MCTKPKTAYQLKPEYWTDKDKPPKPIFNIPIDIHRYNEIQVKCRKCIACLKARTLSRALQLYCELQTTEGNSYFLTLTYDDDNIPQGNTLVKKHMVDFHKRLRKWRVKNGHKGKFRFEMCAEYGEKTYRPHYHDAAFNLQIDDLEIWKDEGNYKSYTSKTMNKLWTHGRVIIIPLTLQSCLYVAQHVDKKIDNSKPMHERIFIHQKTGNIIPLPPEREIVDIKTGEIKMISERIPEYSTRSNRPGIGQLWFKKYGLTDLIFDDIRVGDGQKHKMPEYFLKLIEKDNQELYKQIKQQRIDYAKEHKKTHEENEYQHKFNKVMLKQKNKRNKL